MLVIGSSGIPANNTKVQYKTIENKSTDHQHISWLKHYKRKAVKMLNYK